MNTIPAALIALHQYSPESAEVVFDTLICDILSLENMFVLFVIMIRSS